MYFIVAFGLILISVSYSPLDKVVYYGNFGGVSLVIIGACNCLLVRFIPALLTSLAVLISFFILATVKNIDPAIIVNVEVFLSSSCVLGLFGAYKIEKLMRINFMREENLRTKTREVEDSIIYASYIQQALLSSREVLETSDVQNFIFYKPRDIVSGDFYWFRRIKNYLYFAAADCTGHGVPGAFMSVLCMSMLNEVVTKRDLNPPAMILNDLRKRIKKSLQQDQHSGMSHSGMDITLCLFDFETYTLQYSGAFNPLYLIRNGELIEYKVDRMPIGAYPKDNTNFSNREIQLQKNDLIYIFSDGFISQFGGPNNKKFTSKEFKRLLLNIYKQPMESQHQHLMDTFFYWKKNLDQLDDILVIGIKV
jgi:serine phosphatase RsbU (regulator of sigma subunit)